MSKPVTIAPRRFAVATACRPATPAPSTITLAGGTVPAAVVIIPKKRPDSRAAISIAAYPAAAACEESASIAWARVMRGIASIAKLLTSAAASARLVSAEVHGARWAISTCPGCIEPISSTEGVPTRSTTSAPVAVAASETSAPASA